MRIVVSRAAADRCGKGNRAAHHGGLIRSQPAISPWPLGFCDLCRGFPARSIRRMRLATASSSAGERVGVGNGYFAPAESGLPDAVFVEDAAVVQPTEVGVLKSEIGTTNLEQPDSDVMRVGMAQGTARLTSELQKAEAGVTCCSLIFEDKLKFPNVAPCPVAFEVSPSLFGT